MDWHFYFNDLIPALNEGLKLSVLLILPSATLGVIGGVFFGVLRAFGRPALKRFGNGFAALFRGTPLIVQLMIMYFGLPNIGIRFSPYLAAVITFSLCSAAYQSEYVRGGLLSIQRGQMHAAKALGFTQMQTLFTVIMPQAIRNALPGCGNEIIYLIKYSSLAYVVTCIELTGEARGVASWSFRFTECFFVAGIYYLVLVTIADFLLKRVEKKMRIPGFGNQALK